MKVAASESSMPRRCSKVSAVSLARVRSLRYSSRACVSSACNWASSDGGVTLSVTTRRGKFAASGANGATPKAVTAEPSSKLTTAAVRRLGWRCSRASVRATRRSKESAVFNPNVSRGLLARSPTAGCGAGGGLVVWVCRRRPGSGRPLNSRHDKTVKF